MRFYLKQITVCLCLVIIICVTWNILIEVFETRTPKVCRPSVKFQNELHAFTDRVHQVLKVLNVTHFLCYGSLWGQIRFSRLLPWEDKSVMCLINEDITAKDESIFLRAFKNADIQVSYNILEGQYVASPMTGNKKLQVILVLFEWSKVADMYRRIGWIRRLLPSSCVSLDIIECFPPRLVNSPLPMKEFGKTLIPVPREGIELQKYHFKNNWWKEIVAKNC